jgi:hypothetical protein
MPVTLRANVPGALPTGAVWTSSAPYLCKALAETSRGSAQYVLGAPFIGTPRLAAPSYYWKPADTSQSAFAAQQAPTVAPFSNVFAAAPRLSWQPSDTSQQAYAAVNTVAPPAAGPAQAGRHRKQYGVLVGERLLVFDTKAEAEAAARPKLTLRRVVKAAPRLSISLPELERMAAVRGRGQDYLVMQRGKEYARMVALHQELVRREEDEIAAVMLLI